MLKRKLILLLISAVLAGCNAGQPSVNGTTQGTFDQGHWDSAFWQ